MTITAQYNADGSITMTVDGILIGDVPDDMTNRHRQIIAEWEAGGNTIAPFVPPAPAPRSLAVETFWRRTSDSEAATIETAIGGLSHRLQRIFAAATTLTVGDELTVALAAAVTAQLGAERADALLAPGD